MLAAISLIAGLLGVLGVEATHDSESSRLTPRARGVMWLDTESSGRRSPGYARGPKDDRRSTRLPLNDARDESIRTLDFGSDFAANQGRDHSRSRRALLRGSDGHGTGRPRDGLLRLRPPGFGSASTLSCAPDVTAMGRAAAMWISRLPGTTRVVVMGHSTGSQAALIAALEVQRSRPGAALVMAGPTFQPAQRRLAGLALADAYGIPGRDPQRVARRDARRRPWPRQRRSHHRLGCTPGRRSDWPRCGSPSS